MWLQLFARCTSDIQRNISKIDELVVQSKVFLDKKHGALTTELHGNL